MKLPAVAIVAAFAGGAPWEQEFDDAGIPGGRGAENLYHFGGEENYGHPSPELLEQLEGSATRIFRTDRDGAVQVLTDGENLQVSCLRVAQGWPRFQRRRNHQRRTKPASNRMKPSAAWYS
jgi:hypothetical protein